MYKTTVIGKRRVAWLTLLLNAVVLLSACTSLTSTPRITLDASERWVLLPINNLSETAQADQQALGMIETQLRARGIATIGTYIPVQHVSLRSLLDTEGEIRNATQWASRAGYRYAITGTINEWNYKSGVEREPAVGINLKLVDLHTREVLWQANAARTGWGYATLPAVADNVIEDLLKEIHLTATRQ